jgi:hypothetical protein
MDRGGATVGAVCLSKQETNHMTRRIVLSFLLVLAVLANFDCQPNKVTLPVVTGKLVVAAYCGQYIVQVLSGSIPDSSVTKSWTDIDNDSTYTNVFRVNDICTFAAAGVAVGDTITFNLNGITPVQNCYTCDIVAFPEPAASNAVTNIKVMR